MSQDRALLDSLTAAPGRRSRALHVEHVPARPARPVPWPSWVPDELVSAWAAAGVDAPWEHQVRAAELAHGGRSVVVSTGTASGKSLAYLMPLLSAVVEGGTDGDRGATALYLAPTKALASDQLRRLRELEVDGLRAATYDGDTPGEEREWVRSHANVVLTNPDMLHHSMLPGHARWGPFLADLRFVVIDEVHAYRGVFGSHVSAVVRRLRRVAARHGATPVFILASATVADPATSAGRLTGCTVAEVVDDASPRGRLDFVLWEPPLTELSGERGAPVRRTTTAETAELLADLVVAGARTLTFVRSRRGAEVVA
ncbi:MAG: DEAD/DEAH box helicase, partial [Actinomycetota bacterium]|nr:DEAD/DEAH box helicase [Actinomycetota bacterium]